MEFLPVGDSKLKIVMSDRDLADHGIPPQGGSMDDPAVRRAFWRVLELARDEIGFNPADDKVLIQFYPLRAGGGEIFVTKLGLLSDSSARTVARSDRVAILSHGRSLYAFESLDDLVGAARALSAASHGTPPLCELYLDCTGHCYLSVEEYGKGGESCEYPVISEYGRRLTAELSAYIAEHALLIAIEDGVAALAN